MIPEWKVPFLFIKLFPPLPFSLLSVPGIIRNPMPQISVKGTKLLFGPDWLGANENFTLVPMAVKLCTLSSSHIILRNLNSLPFYVPLFTYSEFLNLTL